MSDNLIRLNKALAHAKGIARREADELISAGRITINGKTAALGARIDIGIDQVTIDGQPVASLAPNYTYLLMHKPVGYVCSRKQQGDIPTIYELLPSSYQYLKPVGRLDKDSSGLILLTDDGDFAHRMTHPSFQKTKVYKVTLDTHLAPLHHQMINDHGVNLDDGVSRLQLEREDDDTSWIVTMREGRNRQIRRTFDALGYRVTSLHRTDFGPYHLSLEPGAFDTITVL